MLRICIASPGILRVHPPLQHFVVGVGSETLFRNTIKRQTIIVPVQLMFATKFTNNGTCQLHTYSFRSGHFFSMRFTRYSKALIKDDVTNLVIRGVKYSYN